MNWVIANVSGLQPVIVQISDALFMKSGLPDVHLASAHKVNFMGASALDELHDPLE